MQDEYYPTLNAAEAGDKQKLTREDTRAFFQGVVRKNANSLFLIYLIVSLVIIGVAVDRLLASRYLSELRFSVSDKTNTIRAEIEGNIVAKSLLTRGLVASIEANPDITQEEYANLAAKLVRDDPEILNIAAAPGLVVRYVYPLEPNKGVLGFDYRTSPEQLEAVARTRASGQTVVAGPLELVQGGQGYISRSPVFVTDRVTGDTVFWGIVSVVVDLQEFYRNTGLLSPDLPLEVAIRGRDGLGAQGDVFFGDERVFASNPIIAEVNLPFGSWYLGAIPKGGWPKQAENFVMFRMGFLVVSVASILFALYVVRLMDKRREAENRLFSAIEAIDDGFALYDADGKFVTCNQNYKEFYKLSEDLFVPGNSFEYIIREGVRRGQYPAAAGQEEKWIRQRLMAHKTADTQLEQQIADGRWLKIAERKTDDGSTVGFRVDITELKNAKEAAEKANKAKSDFLSVLSHELRTPLTVILGYTRIIASSRMLPSVKALFAAIEQDKGPGSDIENQLGAVLDQLAGQAKRIEDSGEHLLTLINEMLDFSTIEAGKMALERDDVNLDLVVTSVIEKFRLAAEQKSLRIGRQTHGEHVNADVTRLKQVLINLVGNAVKFTDEGAIEVRSRRVGDMIEVSVVDTGCGIPEKDSQLVFEEFQQADLSSTRKAGGTGLGLAICKRIIELHGGTIELSSVVGEGSTFRFTIPAAAAE
ncbi:hypothetical protein JT55_02460 [Rhodovulum sp. NI22]|nr:hypothetical protein JT55_02460 [Rhodovulum sp. NI22]